MRTTPFVRVSFAYDMFGAVTDIGRCSEVLAAARYTNPILELCSDPAPDNFALRTWNLSYLSTSGTTLSAELSPGVADFSGTLWRFERSLKIYPMLGVLGLDYSFYRDLSEDQTVAEQQLLQFYDGLVEWKNRDYRQHLRKSGVALPAEIAAQHCQPLDIHWQIVDGIRSVLADNNLVESTVREYYFHDFRPVFVLPATWSAEAVNALLHLSSSTAISKQSNQDNSIQETCFRGVEVLSTGWSTVILQPDSAGEAGREARALVGLVHAQWFVCQAWIGSLSGRSDYWQEQSKRRSIQEFTEVQFELATSLLAVDNFDLMLKDPEALRVARCLAEAFAVQRHRDTIARRISAVEDYTTQLSRQIQNRNSAGLEVLFALSAAASLVALYQAYLPDDGSFALPAGALVSVVMLFLLLLLPVLTRVILSARDLFKNHSTKREMITKWQKVKANIQAVRQEERGLANKEQALVFLSPNRSSAAERERITALLNQVSDEFVPPLRQRSSTSQTHFSPDQQPGQTSEPDGEFEYLTGLLQQHSILVYQKPADGGEREPELAGLLSYRDGIEIAGIDDAPRPAYVSTIAISPQFRRKGLARSLYQQLFVSARARGYSDILVRTWSTNLGHIKMLEELQFSQALTIPNDRGPGLDTIYFRLNLNGSTGA